MLVGGQCGCSAHTRQGRNKQQTTYVPPAAAVTRVTCILFAFLLFHSSSAAAIVLFFIDEKLEIVAYLVEDETGSICTQVDNPSGPWFSVSDQIILTPRGQNGHIYLIFSASTGSNNK